MRHLLLAALLFATPVHARWASDDDADAAVEFEAATVDVRADGTYVETIEREVRILKEQARSREGTARLVYNSRAASVTVLEARTDNDGKIHKVAPELIQDKPLASTRQGFDQLNQVMVAYPEVRVGSRVYLRYRQEHREVPFEGFYSDTIIQGWNEWLKRGEITFRSELPLFIETNDPDGVLRVRESREDGKHVVNVRLRKPLHRRVLDEQDVYLSSKRMTWIDVSTQREWSGMAAPVLGRYEAIANAPLPPAYEKILRAARAKKDTVDQLNTVTSLLAEEVHYWADWRPIRGGHVPRELATIAESKFGDCKDFAISTTAILRKLGVEAWVAWVKRDYRPVLSPTNLPSAGAFNHAIVRARAGGRDYWIDPTNRASFAQGVFEDITDRPSLVLYPAGAKLERIPAANPADSRFALKLRIDPREDEARFEADLFITGRLATPYAGDGLNRTRESIDYGILRGIAVENRLKSWKFEDYDLTSRVTRDLAFRFKYAETDVDLKTSAGPGFLLHEPSMLRRLQVNLENRVGDLFLSQPYTIQREYLLENVRSPGAAKLGCVIESPWFDARREVSEATGAGVRVVDRYVLKRALIPIEDLRGKEFRELQARLRRCFDNIAVVYERPQKL
jgi:transglutaminase-like putative cysteine protease